jgi:hypothetical protein
MSPVVSYLTRRIATSGLAVRLAAGLIEGR